ncbi:acyl-CoA-binding domain-containing protein 4-like [Camellia sinensis]|uniref:acyl-CoA-binding domain-containing protein 4-like n=1 Tax=Camellia sinensis TaxID=4442 RepID=UPI00103690E3|nr:acyl-CoA-binding domain-containing protein 4-like [Camellia sinensis]
MKSFMMISTFEYGNFCMGMRCNIRCSSTSKCDSHTCSSWKSKIIVIGGEDVYYLSDVHILDADALMRGKLNTSGQLLPPRAGHITVALGKNLFVFGGFTDESSLYDDIHMLDVDGFVVWTCG